MADLGEEFEKFLEEAFWRFDALHKANYRDIDWSMVGPMSERDAFKSAVRWLLRHGPTHRVGTEEGR